MWRDEAYLLDMLLAARKALEFARDLSWEQFAANDMVQYAIMHLVQTIGEAARKVSPEFKADHPEIPWPAIIGMRHRLVHEYFRIIPKEVWQVVEKDLPALIPALEPLIPPEEPSGQ